MKVTFIKMARIFCWNRYFLIYPHKCTLKKIEEKVPGKVGECIFHGQKCKSFQGPKVGPGPRPISYGLLCLPDLLHYVSKISEKISGPPLDQILDPLLGLLTISLYPTAVVSATYLSPVLFDTSICGLVSTLFLNYASSALSFNSAKIEWKFLKNSCCLAYQQTGSAGWAILNHVCLWAKYPVKRKFRFYYQVSWFENKKPLTVL